MGGVFVHESMKVLLINDREEGGGAEIVYQETYKLLQTARTIESVRKSSPRLGRFKSTRSVIRMFNFPYAILLIREILNYRPDIIHIHNYIYAVSPLALLVLRIGKRIIGFTIVHTAHDFHLVCPNTGLIRYLAPDRMESCCRCVEDKRWINVVKYNCDRRGLAMSLVRFVRHQVCYRWLHLEGVIDQIICPSASLAMKVRQVYPEKFITVLRNPSFIEPDGMRPIVGESTKLNVLGYFGRLAPEKGVYQFIDNDYDIDRYPTFLIYGDGEEKAKIQELIRKKNLEGSILLMGAIPHSEMSRAIQLVDAVVLPSICYENCPLVVCDALKMGKEVISSSPGGVAELLSEWQNGNRDFVNTTTYQEGLLAIYRDLIG